MPKRHQTLRSWARYLEDEANYWKQELAIRGFDSLESTERWSPIRWIIACQMAARRLRREKGAKAAFEALESRWQDEIGEKLTEDIVLMLAAGADDWSLGALKAARFLGVEFPTLVTRRTLS